MESGLKTTYSEKLLPKKLLAQQTNWRSVLTLPHISHQYKRAEYRTQQILPGRWGGSGRIPPGTGRMAGSFHCSK